MPKTSIIWLRNSSDPIALPSKITELLTRHLAPLLDLFIPICVLHQRTVPWCNINQRNFTIFHLKMTYNGNNIKDIKLIASILSYLSSYQFFVRS